MTQILAPFYSSLSTTTFTLPPNVKKKGWGGEDGHTGIFCMLFNQHFACRLHLLMNRDEVNEAATFFITFNPITF